MAKVVIIESTLGDAGERDACSIAVNCDAAFEQLGLDKDLAVVVIDYDTVSDEIADFVALVRDAWPLLLIVGQADSDRSMEFAECGVAHFLSSSWQMSDLLACALDQHKNVLCSRLALSANRADGKASLATATATPSCERIGATASSLLVQPRLSKISDIESGDLEFLRENQAFGVLSNEALKVVHLLGDLVTFEPGSKLFEAGDPCDNLFVIKSGVVEIRRDCESGTGLSAAAFLSAGDVLCEMGVLPGTIHQSMACAPDGAEVLCIERGVFTELLTMFPQLAVHMYAVMARRLEAVAINAGGPQSNYRKLQGCLEHFDLAMILQSLILGEERSGILAVYNQNNDVIARIQMGSGRISSAEMGRLQGQSALYRLFQADFSQHSFTFRERVDGADAMLVDEALIGISGVNLLLDAARVSDEVSRLRQTFLSDGPEMLVREVDVFEWTDEVTRDLADRIFAATEKAVSIDEVIDRVAVVDVEFFEVLAELVSEKILRTEPLRPLIPGVGSWLMDEDWVASECDAAGQGAVP